MNAVINGRIIVPDAENNFVEKKDTAIIFDEKIIEIVPTELCLNSGKNFAEVFDAKNNFVAPGFINIHIHGSVNCDTMDASETALGKMAKFQATTGVTAFLPTTMTAPPEKIYAALDKLKAAMEQKNDTFRGGAQILGAHMEGPFISQKYHGAQSPDYIIAANFDFVENYADVIKIITFAPETISREKELADFLRRCLQRGIVPSIGHSAADEATAQKAVNMGAKSFTHLFNGMSGVHHRNGGAALAALASDATVELIADDIHVCPSAQKLVWRAKRGQNVVLITDSLRACGIGDGKSELGGQEVFVKNNVATLKDGTIAGSVITLNKAVKNFWRNTGENLPKIIETVTKNPALLIGEYERRGSLQCGKCADITIFDDELNIKCVIIAGKFVVNETTNE